MVGLTIFQYDEMNAKFWKPYVLPSSRKNVRRHLFSCFGYKEQVCHCGISWPGGRYGRAVERIRK
jgi:hypothetical protein